MFLMYNAKCKSKLNVIWVYVLLVVGDFGWKIMAMQRQVFIGETFNRENVLNIINTFIKFGFERILFGVLSH